MANPNKANVSVGKPLATGGVYRAPAGTQVPTDATTPLGGKFENLGYVSEDGLTNAVETDSEEIKAWGGDTVLVAGTSRTETFVFTLIESLNPGVLKAVFGDKNVEGGRTLHNSLEKEAAVWVFEILLTGNKVRRIVVPSGKVTEVGETAYVDGEPLGYETTVTALPDEAGNTAYEYTADIKGEPGVIPGPEEKEEGPEAA